MLPDSQYYRLSYTLHFPFHDPNPCSTFLSQFLRYIIKTGFLLFLCLFSSLVSPNPVRGGQKKISFLSSTKSWKHFSKKSQTYSPVKRKKKKKSAVWKKKEDITFFCVYVCLCLLSLFKKKANFSQKYKLSNNNKKSFSFYELNSLYAYRQIPQKKPTHMNLRICLHEIITISNRAVNSNNHPSTVSSF